MALQRALSPAEADHRDTATNILVATPYCYLGVTLMSGLRFPTFSFSGFTSDVPAAEWQAARQALGIALRDDSKWLKETWAGIIKYGTIGVYSYDFDRLDDGLNSLDTSYNFKVVLASSAGISRYQRGAVAVDYTNRTFVVATGAGTDDWDSGPDDYGVVIVVGSVANEIAGKLSAKCNGSMSKLGERMLAAYYPYLNSRTAVGFYTVDPVKLTVTAGNATNHASVTTFKIDRW